MTETHTYRKRPVNVEARRLPEPYPDDVDPATDLYARNHQAADIFQWITANKYPWLIGDALEPDTLRYPDQTPGDNSRPDKGIYIDPATGHLVIRTLEGDMHAAPGDWIIQGVAGEFYPCKPDIFAATYETAWKSTPAGSLEEAIRDASAAHDGSGVELSLDVIGADCACGETYPTWEAWQSHQAAEIANAVHTYQTQQWERAAFEVASKHHKLTHICTCGFESYRNRDHTEHIVNALATELAQTQEP